MNQSPVEELQSRSGVAKSDDETVREYVRRVGTESDVDSDTVEGALTYITEWHYSDVPPEDDEAFRGLLHAASSEEGLEAPSEERVREAEAPNSSRLSDPNRPERELDTDRPGESPDLNWPTGSADSESATGEQADDASESPSTGKEGRPDSTEGEATDSGDLTEGDPGDGSDSERTVGEESVGQGEATTYGGSPASRTASGEDGGRLGFKSGIRGREPRKLLLRFVAIAATTPVIGWLMARAWVRGNPVYEQIRATLAQITGLPAPTAVDLVAVFVIGLYASLLVLFLGDIKKRVQGVLLVVGTVLSLSTVGFLGVFFSSLELTVLNVLTLVLGFAAGFVLESGQLLAIDFDESTFQRPTLETGEIPEFRHAATFLFGLVAAVLVTTLAQVFVTGQYHVVDVPAVAVFVVLLYQFVQYESETDYMTLGPERSGKSMLLLGLCLELLRRSETHPNPNSYLQQGLERASNLRPGRERWPIPSTAPDEVRAASFEVISGYYFPRRLELTALDYAGQHLSRITDVLASEESLDPDESVPQQVASRIAAADTLFFLLDVERLVYPEEFRDPGSTDREHISWGLDQYTTIVEEIDPDDVVVIATKCDILIDQKVVSSPPEYDSYSLFADAVTDHLLTRPDVQELLNLTETTSVHPVYYETERRDGEYVPLLDGNGNLIPIGYDHLIDEIRERQ